MIIFLGTFKRRLIVWKLIRDADATLKGRLVNSISQVGGRWQIIKNNPCRALRICTCLYASCMKTSKKLRDTLFLTFGEEEALWQPGIETHSVGTRRMAVKR